MVDEFRDFVYVVTGVLSGHEKEPMIRGGILIVNEGEHALVGSRYKMLTYDLTTCMAVVSYNLESKVGLMAHIPDITYTSKDNLDSIANKFSKEVAQKTGSDSSEFNSILVGLTYFVNNVETNWDKYMTRKKKWATYMEEKLQDYGFNMFDSSDFIAQCKLRREIVLNNSTGELYITGKLQGGDIPGEPIVEKATLFMDSGEINYKLDPKSVNKVYFLRK